MSGKFYIHHIPDTPALLADFSTDSTVRYSYGWYGGGTIYYGAKTGTFGPIHLGAAATYITADLHTDYFSSSGAYYDCYRFPCILYS